MAASDSTPLRPETKRRTPICTNLTVSSWISWRAAFLQTPFWRASSPVLERAYALAWPISLRLSPFQQALLSPQAWQHEPEEPPAQAPVHPLLPSPSSLSNRVLLAALPLQQLQRLAPQPSARAHAVVQEGVVAVAAQTASEI